MFKINDRKGFHITFENGCTVSVQFGKGDYGDNYRYRGDYHDEMPASQTAEVAAWDEMGNWIKLSEEDDLAAYQSPSEVLEIMNKVANR